MLTSVASRRSPVTRWGRITAGHGSTIHGVAVPLSLLLSKELTPAAKFLWIRLRFDEIHRRRRSHRPRQLAKRTGLARSTVYEALRRGTACGWFDRYRDPKSGKQRWRTIWRARRGDRVVRIPVDLVRAAHELRPQAILCYGLLQATTEPNKKTGNFKWADLRMRFGLNLRTIKRAVRALAETRWIWMAQRHRKEPIQFGFQHADEAYKEEVTRSLEKANFVGEALMRSYLSLIVDSKESEDGARPEFLVNPASGERMEFDRYYPVHRVAFEFNGPQHYAAAGTFSKQEVAAQRKRDRLKRQICRSTNIELVVIHAEDLSLAGMWKKVGDLLPRKALRGFRQTIRYLDFCARRYREVAQRGRRDHLGK